MAKRKNEVHEAETDNGETVHSDDLPAVLTSKTPTAQVGGTTYRMKRRVVLPLLKHASNQTVYIQIIGLVYVGKEIPAKPGAVKQAPAKLVNVIDLTTGEEMIYIVSAVLESTLDQEYPDGGYLNKSFAIFKVPPDIARGKRYATFSVAEIEPVG